VVQSTPTINHTYTTPSDYKATLRVRDSRGATSSNTAIATINVEPANQPPNASLAAAPTSGPAALKVNFDGSGSSDADAGDTIASYTFTFGDGSAPVTQSGPTLSHTYNAAGTYVASLAVTDSRGLKSTNSAQVAITVQAAQPNNTAPTASLTATPTSGVVPLNVKFDGSRSTDKDKGDTIASYSFNFGDGSGIVTLPSSTVTHTYNRAGTYSASLVVTDSRGKPSSNTAAVTISATPQAPSSVSGSGILDSAAKISFGLKVSSNLTGTVSYKDNANNVGFDTSMISSYWLSGNCATFSGSATLKSNGAAVTYTITACDNGSGGSTDTFAIQLSGGSSYQQSGTLRGGNITITRK
jgi:PKD repeat protein